MQSLGKAKKARKGMSIDYEVCMSLLFIYGCFRDGVLLCTFLSFAF